MFRVSNLNGFGARRPSGGSYDTDAQAFFTAAGITDNTQKDAVNQLVLDLKSAGVWSKLDAIYPMVGGTSSTHSYNLKNPAAFQITWTGTITHDANGVTGGGTDSHGDTGWNQSTHGLTDDEHMSCYSRTDSNINVNDMGVTTAGTAGTRLKIRSTNLSRTLSQTTAQDDVSNTASLGYFSVNRTASTGYRFRANATNTSRTLTSNQALENRTCYILAANVGGSAAQRSTRNYAWFAIGSGLTETEDGDLRTAVETFQDALSRGVV